MLKKYLYSTFKYFNTFSLVALLWQIRLKITGKTILLSGTCKGCGACCQKLNLEVAGGWIRSDVHFQEMIVDHPEFSRFKIIGKDEKGYLQFSCSWLTSEGSCQDYQRRLAICRNFPETSLVFCGGGLPEGCGYRFHEGIPFDKVLEREKKKIQ